ncbi:RnfABCDGE type electron transport complex subunit D [Denitromonas iodatirespirans]|uniref:Ion-translocating oxidoreductase complex subunit D n=1 Tax=Denitromonas iodatirespirans TaxID=2795389 RepID=A0A944H7Q2_DENI1|nr:RnfABCDGE type electron transport complex subunit D [Denitromonas iodatirespirans]MBT0960535.1 RnfABCDGE type electron transport complex subunit D [Denitromonas iodatirespirans]
MNPLTQGAATVASPHAHGGNSVARCMLDVQLALTPATLFGFWLYGWPAFILWVGTIAACLFWEAVCLRLQGVGRVRETLFDGSAALTGWLLAMTLPPWAPWWLAVVGGFIAIVIGKQVFGGLGQNVFNPAMVARVALLVSFPLPMTAWISPLPLHALPAPELLDSLRIFLGAPIPDAMTSATWLGHAKTELMRGVDLLQVTGSDTAPPLPWTGLRAGSLGESSAVLLLAGGLYLIVRGVISWHAPLALLAGLALPALIGHSLDPARYLAPSVHLLGGGAMLGAFFIATDYVTSPNTRSGQLVFGFGIGLIAWIIRSWGGYPEGMGFAVLLMNALTPILDRFVKPRVLGRDRRGRPLDLPEREGT